MRGWAGFGPRGCWDCVFFWRAATGRTPLTPAGGAILCVEKHWQTVQQVNVLGLIEPLSGSSWPGGVRGRGAGGGLVRGTLGRGRGWVLADENAAAGLRDCNRSCSGGGAVEVGGEKVCAHGSAERTVVASPTGGLACKRRGDQPEPPPHVDLAPAVYTAPVT